MMDLIKKRKKHLSERKKQFDKNTLEYERVVLREKQIKAKEKEIKNALELFKLSLPISNCIVFIQIILCPAHWSVFFFPQKYFLPSAVFFHQIIIGRISAAELYNSDFLLSVAYKVHEVLSI